ncbi:hypothetical protein D3C77_490710 [compost metagenome]
MIVDLRNHPFSLFDKRIDNVAVVYERQITRPNCRQAVELRTQAFDGLQMLNNFRLALRIHLHDITVRRAHVLAHFIGNFLIQQNAVHHQMIAFLHCFTTAKQEERNRTHQQH